jgi:hypothetical protein
VSEIDATRSDRLEDWLFAILRFAVTRTGSDRAAVLGLAELLDGSNASAHGFSFFARSSAEICAAIADEDAPDRDAILRRFAARLQEPRLRVAFTAATGVTKRQTSEQRTRARLWDGLVSPTPTRARCF